MTKSLPPMTIPPCGCANCLCRRGPRCRCHDYNALLDLAIWNPGRGLHGPQARDRGTPVIRPAARTAGVGSIIGSAMALPRLDTLNVACLLAFVVGAATGLLLAV